MRGVGRIRRRLADMLVDAGVSVYAEDLRVIPTGGSAVYTPPQWEAHGTLIGSRESVRIFSWVKMSDLVRSGVMLGAREYMEVEIVEAETTLGDVLCDGSQDGK